MENIIRDKIDKLNTEKKLAESILIKNLKHLDFANLLLNNVKSDSSKNLINTHSNIASNSSTNVSQNKKLNEIILMGLSVFLSTRKSSLLSVKTFLSLLPKILRMIK